jgi:membrane protein YqaA with SNARE-associated domain
VIATAPRSSAAIFGWFLGHYAYEYIARPMLEFYGSLAKFEELRNSASGNFQFLVLMLVTPALRTCPR